MAIKKPKIRQPLPPVQPPVGPPPEAPEYVKQKHRERIAREAMLPLEPLGVPKEELPPVEPMAFEPTELYPLITRIYPSYPTLKPEELQTQMAELSSWAQKDPEAFLYDLDFRTTPEERDFVLRALGVTEEYFAAEETVEEEEARISGIVTDVFPELTPDELIDYATEDYGSFLSSLLEKGQTRETEALLGLIGLNRSEIASLFGIAPFDLDQLPIGSYRITDFSLEDISKFALKDPLSFEAALAFEGRTDETMEILGQLYGTEVLDEKFLKNIFEKDTGEKFISGEWMPDILQDFWGAFWTGAYDLISISGSIADRLGNESVAGNLKLIGLAGHDIMPTIDAEAGSVKWYALNLTRMIPMLTGLIGVSLTTGGTAYSVVGAVGGGPLLQAIVGTITAGAVSSVGEGALEAGDAYQMALDRGYSQEEANAVFDRVIRHNVGLLSVTNTAQFGLTFFLPGGATAALITKGLIFGFDVVSEGLEEGVQLAITREALGDPQKFDEEMWQNVILGLAGGLGFAGVGAVFNSIQSRIDGKMTDEQKAIFQRDTGEGVAQGLSRREAEMKAYDKFAETTEGEAIITEAVNEITAEEREQNVEEGRKAAESIDPALEGIEVDNERVRDLVEEVITPEVVPTVPEAITIDQFERTLTEVISETKAEIKASKEWLRKQRVRELEPAARREIDEETARVASLEDRLPTLQEMLDNTGEYLPRLRSEFPNIYKLLLDRGRELKIIPSPRAVKVAPPLTEALIREGDELVTMAEAIEPTNASVIEFRRLVEQAKVATTPETQREVLAQMEALEDEVRVIAKVPIPEEVAPEVEFEAREEIAGLKEYLATEPASRLTHFVKRVGKMKGELPNITIQQYKDMTGKTTVRENILTPDKKHVMWEYAFDETATEMGIIENGEALRERIMMAWEAQQRIKELEAVRAEGVLPPTPEVTPEAIEAAPPVVGKYASKPMSIKLPPSEPISKGVAEHTQGLSEITAKEEVRPTRKVFTKMGIWRDFYKPMQKAEVVINEEKEAGFKAIDEQQKLAGKDTERWALIFDEVNKRGSVIGLTFNEKRVVNWFRKWADKWAVRKNLPIIKRVKDYIPHLFEEEVVREMREENGIDPVMARLLDDKFAGKITDRFLKQRLGREVGLLKDPFAAARAYEAVSLRSIHYAPLLNKINAYIADPNIPDGSRRYLLNFAKRMTGELTNGDIALNKMIGGFAEAIRKAPLFGEWLYSRLTTGNPAGFFAYNATGILYGLWLGFKPTSAIRNLSQHILIMVKVGPAYFADAFRLGLTSEGRAAWKDSINRRSRKRAFLPGYDSSLIWRLPRLIIDLSLKMFRGADWVNTHTAFLAGCSEAKAILTEANDKLSAEKKLSPERLREFIIERGDEVFADTQYLYTKMNSMAFAQNAPGRVFSMLTTWTGNWLELMTSLVKRTPSQVYLEFEQQTGAKVVGASWSETYKGLLLYMMIVGLGFALWEKTRLKAWEYTGITSVRYLADIFGGDFPALQAPGAIADTIVGFLTKDERRLNEGLYKLKTTFTPAVMRQLDSIAAGDKDWLTFFLYVEGKNIEIKRLKDKWEKDWEDYPIFEDAAERTEYLKKHPQQIGLSDARIRSKWREDNPLIEAKMFVVSQFTTLSSDEARAEVLRLIEKHKLDTELIDGYDKVFGIDTREALSPFEKRLGKLEKLVVAEEAEYFTMGNYVSEVNALVKSVGRHKVQKEASPLTRGILEAQDTFEAFEAIEEGDARTLWRQQFPEAEAWMYLLGKVSSFKNPKSAEILLGLMKKYNIPPEAISAFIEDPERYDELFTQKFELEQKWFDQTTEYENFGNTEAPNYIEDTELRKEARTQFKEDNPDWVADMRRIEAIDHDATPGIIDKWAERGREIDKFGAGSAEAKLWLLKNPETLDWALEEGLLESDLSEENIELLQLTADNRGLFEAFSAIDAEAQDKRLAFRAKHPDFDKFLIEVKGYAPHSLRETIRVFRETEGDEKFELLRGAVYEYGQLAVKDSLTSEEVFAYTWDIRSFDWKKHTILPHLIHWGNEFYKVFDWLSRKPDAEQLKRIAERVPDFGKHIIDVLLPIYQSEPSDKFPIKTWEALLYLTVNSYRDGAEKLIELVEEIGIPNQWDKMKAEIQKIPHNKPTDWPEGVDWYQDDWFFIEHPIFYKAMVETGAMKEKDFSTVPTREVFDKYLKYIELPHQKAKKDYRWENPDLDAWGVLRFGWVSIIEQKRRAELTPSEEFYEDIADKEGEFAEAMRELERLLEEVR